MTNFKTASLGLAALVALSGGFAQTATAAMAKMSAADSKMMNSCMAMAPDAMMKDASCMAMMKKAKMSDADMKMAMSCKAMTKDAMMADKDCMAMNKMHPGMMMMK